ncbi:MAG: tetratricopeptide repeat protein [Acidobacteria bacterium]|nr:tetratricopeptide repeat protein [Acidobacteriota bacterium]
MIISLAVAALGICPAFGQDDLRNSVYGNQKKSADKSKTTPKKKNPPPVAKSPKRSVPKPSTETAKKNPAGNPVNVTFLSREPSVEVYLNEKNIGATDVNFQLSKKLAPGEYLLMAKNKRQVLLPTKKITVFPETTSIKLYEEVVVKPPPPKEKPVETEEKSEIELAIEISEKVKKILTDYNNPATTDLVTVDDWQIVFQAAQLGRIQNYTAVQIEAQRWFATGQIELSKKEFTNAFTAFTKAIEFMPTSALPYYGLGNTYFAKQQYLDAAKMYQKAVQTEPQMAMAHKKLGDALRLQGKSKEAIAAYKNAIQNGYNTIETRMWLANLMLDTKQIEEALETLEGVAREMPKAEIYIMIGSGYQKLKRDVSAIEAYQKAIDADPNSALAYYRLAEVYLNQREYPKAKEAYEKALSIDSDGKTINRADAQRKLREAAGKINR